MKRWQVYTKELYKKDLNNPDNHDGVITHLEPDFLEREVKWALLRKHPYEQSQWRRWNSIDLFQILKTQQQHQDWKRSVFIPIPKKGNAKECSNYYTIALISHTSKVMLKILQARLRQYMNCELRLQRNQRSNCQHPLDHRKSKRVPEKHLFLLY